MVALVAILLGFTVGCLTGGSLKAATHRELPGALGLLVLFVVQGLARGRLGQAASVWGSSVWLAASVAIVLWAFWVTRGHAGASWFSPGLQLAAIGTMLNALVFSLNGWMPAVETGAEFAASVGRYSGFYGRLDEAAMLPWLADVIPLPWPGGLLLVSAGDVLLWTGVTVLAAAACWGE